MKSKLLKIALWFPSAVIMLFVTIQTYLSLGATTHISGLIRQEVSILRRNQLTFAALPRAAFEIKTALASEDARPIVIEKYFARYSSPMAGYGQYIVETADAKGLDPYLVVAIAQQESNLGKLMPSHDCHNAWGWGIHTAGTLCFATWDEGIHTFITGLSDKYLAFGLITPEQIMTKYNATSPGGAWAKGVNQFLYALQTGNF